jgi:hypothetical protein
MLTERPSAWSFARLPASIVCRLVGELLRWSMSDASSLHQPAPVRQRRGWQAIAGHPKKWAQLELRPGPNRSQRKGNPATPFVALTLDVRAARPRYPVRRADPAAPLRLRSPRFFWRPAMRSSWISCLGLGLVGSCLAGASAVGCPTFNPWPAFLEERDREDRLRESEAAMVWRESSGTTSLSNSWPGASPCARP